MIYWYFTRFNLIWRTDRLHYNLQYIGGPGLYRQTRLSKDQLDFLSFIYEESRRSPFEEFIYRRIYRMKMFEDQKIFSEDFLSRFWQFWTV